MTQMTQTGLLDTLTMRLLVSALVVACLATLVRTQDAVPTAVDPLHQSFDEILDAYVRDGFVYYFALKQERVRFDRYVSAISDVSGDTVKQWSRERQLAYWINAYNAFVLQTVIDHYPIQGSAPQYPPVSIRQVPGAFERHPFRAGGRTLTLDGLERDVIAGFDDARALLALGRGAIGSGRLKSEAYSGERLDAQLSAIAGEVVTRREMVKVDQASNQLSVSPLFSWRETVFNASWAGRAPGAYATRSPIERAVLALIDPVTTPGEAAFLRKNQFEMVFHEFDWRLNDLSTRGR